MVSACAYSGAYPTGYGLYELNTEGVPPRIYDGQIASGFTHFQQSGTGAIRKYYNYFRVTPMLEPLDALGSTWDLTDEQRRARLLRGDAELRHPLRAHRRARRARCTATRSRRTATPGWSSTSRWAAWPSRTARPCRCGPTCRRSAPASRRPRSWSRAPRWPCTWSATPGDWRQLLWYDRRLMPGGTRLDFDRIRPTTLRPFGLMWRGPTEPGQVARAAVRFLAARRRAGAGEPARRLPAAATGRRSPATPADDPPQPVSDRRVRSPARAPGKPGAITWTDPRRDPSTARRTVFATALYHSLIKPCFAAGREPVLADGRPVRLRHLHHVGHLPDPAAADHRPVPGPRRRAGQRAARHLRGGGQPADRLPDGQGRRPVLPPGQRAGPDVPGRPLPARRARASTGTGRCATWTTTCAARTARSTCSAAWPTRSPTPSTSRSATTARPWSPAHVGDTQLAEQFDGAGHPVGERVRPRDRAAGRLRRTTRAASGTTRSGCCTTCRPGSSWPAATSAFIALLDAFFGYGADPVKQVGERPSVEELARRVRAQPLRGPEQRAGHGGPLGLPLRRPAGPHRRGRACRRAQPVRPRPRRPARQRRLRRAELLVRLGLARPVPRRRPEPLPDQRALVRPVPADPRRRGS